MSNSKQKLFTNSQICVVFSLYYCPRLLFVNFRRIIWAATWKNGWISLVGDTKSASVLCLFTSHQVTLESLSTNNHFQVFFLWNMGHQKWPGRVVRRSWFEAYPVTKSLCRVWASLPVFPLIASSVKIEKSYRFYLLCLKVLWCCIDICIELLLKCILNFF